MKVLILGVSGMLGNTMFRRLSLDPLLAVFGSARTSHSARYFSNELQKQMVTGVDEMCIRDSIRIGSINKEIRRLTFFKNISIS